MNSSQQKPSNDSIFTLVISLAIIAAIAAGILAVADIVTKGPRDEAVLKATVKAFRELQPEFDNDPDIGKLNVVSDNGKKWIVLKKDESLSKYGRNVVTFYPAKEKGKLIALFGKAVSHLGYGGDLTVLLAMKPSGEIINVVVTENKETPGLGTAVFARNIQKTIWGIFKGEYKNSEDKLAPNPLMDFFNGKIYSSSGKLSSEQKELLSVTGASSEVNKNKEPIVVKSSKWTVRKDGGYFEYVTGATISSRAVTFGVKKIVSVYYDTQKEVISILEEKQTNPRQDESEINRIVEKQEAKASL